MAHDDDRREDEADHGEDGAEDDGKVVEGDAAVPEVDLVNYHDNFGKLLNNVKGAAGRRRGQTYW